MTSRALQVSTGAAEHVARRMRSPTSTGEWPRALPHPRRELRLLPSRSFPAVGRGRTGRSSARRGRACSAAHPRCRGAGRAARGVSASMTYLRTVSTCPGAAATTASQPASVRSGVGRAAVLGAREALDQAAVLQPANHVGQPRERGVRALGERRHPQRALGRLGEHREHEVLEVGQSGVAPQLGVQHPGQQLDDRDQPHPRGALRPRRAIASSMGRA